MCRTQGACNPALGVWALEFKGSSSIAIAQATGVCVPAVCERRPLLAGKPSSPSLQLCKRRQDDCMLIRTCRCGRWSAYASICF